jgi:hypothetical protein
MDEFSTTVANQTDEEILTSTVSDEALEAAASADLVATIPTLGMTYHCCTIS